MQSSVKEADEASLLRSSRDSSPGVLPGRWGPALGYGVMSRTSTLAECILTAATAISPTAPAMIG